MAYQLWHISCGKVELPVVVAGRDGTHPTGRRISRYAVGFRARSCTAGEAMVVAHDHGFPSCVKCRSLNATYMESFDECRFRPGLLVGKACVTGNELGGRPSQTTTDRLEVCWHGFEDNAMTRGTVASCHN